LTKLAPNILLVLVPFGLAIAYWWLNPFSQTIVCNAVSLSHLTPAQKSNLTLAAQALNGAVLANGQTLSFNQAVGARTAQRGYSRAPSYLGGDTPMTFGGGVCLLSSLLYKTALESGLPVKERWPHTRTVASVPAGFDATVSYGQSDLKLTNNSGMALQIVASIDSDLLKVELLGERNSLSRLHKFNLKRIVVPTSADQVEVTVLREEGPKLTLLSRDFYRLPARLAQVVEVKRQIDKHRNSPDKQH
jgi:vancomycin resistance protein YoaR